MQQLTKNISGFLSREVKVGKVSIGGANPVIIQSMTNTNTCDVDATVEQILKLEQAGAQVVRMTVQGMKEVSACEKIKNKLIHLKCEIPLVADIHFFPKAAIGVVDFVDKVRINPGNFVDKRAVFKRIILSDEQYAQELISIEESFLPLIEKCKKLKKPIRLGVNHGSLSDRILSKYGDTPLGMIHSCFEYIDVAKKYDFHDLVISMKSSNTLVMIEAYRVLVKMMKEKGYDYPLHLGLTEAGFGVDGRVKSVLGLGTLLLEGIGDTIRMSLTEDPVQEISPCKTLLNFIHRSTKGEQDHEILSQYKRKRVSPLIKENFFVAREMSRTDQNEESKADLIFDNGLWFTRKCHEEPKIEYQLNTSEIVNFSDIDSISKKCNLLFLDLEKIRYAESREILNGLIKRKNKIPVMAGLNLDIANEKELIEAAVWLGSFIVDGMVDGIFFKGSDQGIEKEKVAFSILQAARKRSYKTEFISCPSCGRTLFDLEKVTRSISEKTHHLKGTKIAVMGCIVNGPGEMADADFGYVGSNPGKIDLYVGKECVEKNIDQLQAQHALINLIKKHGKWIEPKI